MKKLAMLVAIIALGAQAEIYKWTDEKGQIHYGEQPPPTADTKTIKAPAPGPATGDAPPPTAASDTKAAPVKNDKTPTDKGERCKYEKQQLDVMGKGEVRYFDDKKQLQTLSPEKAAAAKAQIQENIKRYCS